MQTHIYVYILKEKSYNVDKFYANGYYCTAAYIFLHSLKVANQK